MGSEVFVKVRERFRLKRDVLKVTREWTFPATGKGLRCDGRGAAIEGKGIPARRRPKCASAWLSFLQLSSPVPN